MTALVFGGSAGIGRALARELAARGYSLLLIARDVRDLQAEAAHLGNLYGVSVEWLAVDASDPEAIRKLVELDALARVRHLFFPIGMARKDDDALLPPELVDGLVNANLTCIIATISILLPRLLKETSANIVGIGSIAAVRGRSANVVYAAAKRGLESYFESLRHRTASSGVRVQFYRLGYVDTQMLVGSRVLFPPVSPQKVAKLIIGNLGKDVGCITFPAFWGLIVFLVKVFPWRLYRRLNF